MSYPQYNTSDVKCDLSRLQVEDLHEVPDCMYQPKDRCDRVTLPGAPYLHESKRYKLVKHIRTGGYGCVFEGYDMSTRRFVVVKLINRLRATVSKYPDGSVLPRECVCLERCARSGGVVRMLDYFLCVRLQTAATATAATGKEAASAATNGSHTASNRSQQYSQQYWAIVMERVDNCVDLFEYISRRRRIPETEALHITLQLLVTLHQCHQVDVLHRDLKDENILIDQSTSKIKLIDFGAGTFLSRAGENGTYRDFEATTVYAPPEWLLTHKYNGKQAEVWSIGILLYDMVFGDVPFRDKEQVKAAKLKWRTPRSTHGGVDASIVSTACTDFISACLRVTPAERPTLPELFQLPWLAAFVAASPQHSAYLYSECPGLFHLRHHSSFSSVDTCHRLTSAADTRLSSPQPGGSHLSPHLGVAGRPVSSPRNGAILRALSSRIDPARIAGPCQRVFDLAFGGGGTSSPVNHHLPVPLHSGLVFPPVGTACCVVDDTDDRLSNGSVTIGSVVMGSVGSGSAGGDSARSVVRTELDSHGSSKVNTDNSGSSQTSEDVVGLTSSCCSQMHSYDS